MRLSAFYRYHAGGNAKQRPVYFSKLACLLSFVRAVEAARGEIDVVFLVDGEVPEREGRVMEQYGRIEHPAAHGNSRSHRWAVRLATSPAAPELVYLSEDDYLYLPASLSRLIAAAETIPEAHYFTLYDHPDRYHVPATRREPRARVFLSEGHHWRSTPSTCMTFGARRATLRADRWAHWVGTVRGFPRDDMIWRATQGVPPFRLKFPKRLLISPVPSLATHMEVDHLAPGLEWKAAADDAIRWGEAHALASPPYPVTST
jgi:hypothetical protein